MAAQTVSADISGVVKMKQEPVIQEIMSTESRLLINILFWLPGPACLARGTVARIRRGSGQNNGRVYIFVYF